MPNKEVFYSRGTSQPEYTGNDRYSIGCHQKKDIECADMALIDDGPVTDSEINLE